MPYENSTKGSKGRFYKRLLEVVSGVKKRDTLIVI